MAGGSKYFPGTYPHTFYETSLLLMSEKHEISSVCRMAEMMFRNGHTA